MKKQWSITIFLVLSVFLGLLPSVVSAQISVPSSATSTATTKTLTINRPAGTVFADLLIAQIVVASTSVTITPPTGWTVIRSYTSTGLQQALYYKAIDPASPSEPGSYAWTFSANVNSVGAIVIARGTDLLAPIVSADSGAVATGVSSLVVPTLTAPVPNAGLFEFFSAVSANSISMPASTSSNTIYKANTLSLGVGYELFVAGGDTGVRTATLPASANTVAQMIVLRPMVLSCFSDDFDDASIADGSAPSNNWVVNQSPGAGNAFLPQIVTNSYSRRLRMTSALGNEATFASIQRIFPAAGNLFTAEFNYYAYGGTGADGMAVTLSDASISPVAGAPGGSLGYAQDYGAGTAGFAGGWLGIGFDEYGNFSTNDRGHCGPNTASRVNSIALRGKGAGSSGGSETCANYPYLAGSAANAIDPKQGGTTPGIGRKYRVTVDSRVPGEAMTKVEVDNTGTGSSYTTLIGPTNVLSAAQTLTPTNFRVSLTSSTGGSTNVHEIDNLNICSLGMTDVRGIDHIRYYFDKAATACANRPVTVRACRDNACTSWYTPSFTLDLKASPVPAAGTPATGWVDASGNGIVTATVAGGNNNTLAFRANGTPSPGTYTLSYANPSVAGGVPGLKLRCFSADGATEWTAGNNPCTIVFTDQANFTVSVPNLIAGIDAVGGSASGTTTPATIKASSSSCGTGSVPAAFNNKASAIKFWFNYTDPLASQVASLLPTNPPAVWLDPYEAAANTTAGFSKLTTAAPASGLSLYFDATGTARFDIAYPDVGQLQLRAQDASSTTAGTGQFTVKPDHFDFSVIERTSDGVDDPGTGTSTFPAATDQNGAVFIKAGNPFTVKLTARAGSNVTTAPLFVSGTCGTSCYGQTTQLFGGETAPEGVSLTPLLVAPSGGNLPALSYSPSSTRTVTIPATEFGSTGMVNDALGVATVSDLVWGDVGIIKLTASVADGNYLGAGNVTTTSSNVGRFIPDGFTVSTTGLTPRSDIGACSASTFTHLGEPFKVNTIVLTARAVGGASTKNYAGVFSKLDLSSATSKVSNLSIGAQQGVSPAFTNFYSATPALNRIVAAYGGTSFSDTYPASDPNCPGQKTIAWCQGVAAMSLDVTIGREALPDGPFANTVLGISPVDSDGVKMSTPDFQRNYTGTGTVVGDGKILSVMAGNELRYGRLRLSNAFGTDKANLSIPVQAQYWSGLSWVVNAADGCTPIAKNAVQLTGALSASNAIVGDVTLSGGVSNLVLACPYATCPPASKPGTILSGSVGVCVDLGADPTAGVACSATSANMSYLQGKWPPGTGSDNDPSARAHFGIYAPETRKTVHVREFY